MKPIFTLFIITTITRSCATSMTPSQINSRLPEMTVSKFISPQNDAGNCELINKSRKYNAPMGLTVKYDLTNGARGIDEWVELDGGNAYKLVNYQWVQVDDYGSTQLQIEFDTMNCDIEK